MAKFTPLFIDRAAWQGHASRADLLAELMSEQSHEWMLWDWDTGQNHGNAEIGWFPDKYDRDMVFFLIRSDLGSVWTRRQPTRREAERGVVPAAVPSERGRMIASRITEFLDGKQDSHADGAIRMVGRYRSGECIRWKLSAVRDQDVSDSPPLTADWPIEGEARGVNGFPAGWK